MQQLPKEMIQFAIKQAKDRLEAFEKQQNYHGVAEVAKEIGTVYVYVTHLKDYDTATHYFELSLKAAEKIGNSYLAAQNLSNIGMALLQLQRYDEALIFTERALGMLSTSADRNTICIALGNLGVIHLHLKNYDQAIKYSTEAIKLDILLGDKFGEAEDNKNLGRAYSEQDRLELALKHYQIAGDCYLMIGKRYDLFKVLCYQGEIALKSKACDQAIQFYQEAYTMKEVVEDPRFFALLCFYLGSALQSKDEFSRSIIILKEGAALIASGELKSQLLKALGDVYNKINDVENAIISYVDAVAALNNQIFESQDVKGDLFREFKFLIVGNFNNLKKEFTYQIISRLEEIKNQCPKQNPHFKMNLLQLLVQIAILRNESLRTIPFLEELIELAKQHEDRFTEAQCLEILAKLKKRTGELSDVVRLRKLALNLFKEMSIKESSVDQLIGIANALQEQGSFEEAIPEYEKAIKIAEDTGYNHGRNVALANLANACRETGDLQKAVNVLEELLETCDETEKAFVLRLLGFCYEDLNEYSKAIELQKISYNISLETNDNDGVLFQVSNMGRIFFHMGALDEALKFHLQALDLSIKLEYLQEQANQLSNIGGIYVVQENPNAIDYLETALAINQKIGNYCQIALISANIGKYYTDAGKLDKAIEHLMNSLNLSIEHNLMNLLYRIYWFLGNAYEQTGNIPLAEQYYEKSLEIIEFYRKNLILEEQKLSFLGVNKTYFYNHICIFNISKGTPLRAFEAVERSKSRSFLDLLGLFTVLESRKLPNEIRTRESELIAVIKSTYKAINTENDSKKKRDLVKKLMQSNKEIEKLFDSMKEFDSEYVSLRNGTPINFAEVKKIL